MRPPCRFHHLYTLIALSACPLGAFSALMPASAATPSARTMLLKSGKAHNALGPCIIESTMSFERPEQKIKKTWATVRWNDSTHFSLTMETDDGPLVLYVNGSKKMVAVPARREWVRLDATNPEHTSALKGFRAFLPHSYTDAFLADFGRSEGQGALSRTPVVPMSLSGMPAYRLFLPTGITMSGSTSFVAFAFGRRDNLIYKVTTRNEEDRESNMTMRYTRRKTKFPATTFAFQPPAGYQEAKTLGLIQY